MTPATQDSGDVSAVRHGYDTVAADYASMLPDTRAETRLDLAMVDAFAARLVGAPVLDAGCGTGRMSQHLAAHGCDVQGVDLSPGMVAMARRDHPDLTFAVGSLSDLPYPDDRFAGVLLWYSTIHTPPAGQARVFAQAARVLRPGGHLLVAFQSGHGTRDISAAYRRFGHEVRLERHLFTADQVDAWAVTAGLWESARLVRRAESHEQEDQTIIHFRARN